MRHIVLCLCCTLIASAPAAAVEFLGVDLCVGSTDTSVVLPVGSPLSLETAEIGRHGGLLLLLKAENGDIMDHIDALMLSYTDSRGTGDAKKLQWSGRQITAYAQLIKKGYAALAVSTTQTCDEAAAAVGADVESGIQKADTTAQPDPPVDATPDVVTAAASAGAAVAIAPEADHAGETASEPASTVTPPADSVTAPVVEEPETPVDFVLKGRFKHAAAEDGWVDVMGVVVNTSGAAYAVASFDLSLYDASGDLICVDTISVNQLRDGQERAFRSAIRCADYHADSVAGWKLQFAGGH